jgi:hypothetical protein
MPFDTLEGVAMHYVNSQDENHTEYDSKYQVKRQSDELQTDTQTDTQTDRDYDLPEFDKTDSSSCCDSPNLKGKAGDTFRLDNGEIIRLDNNEQICIHCEEVQLQ